MEIITIYLQVPRQVRSENISLLKKFKGGGIGILWNREFQRGWHWNSMEQRISKGVALEFYGTKNFNG
jgi:hypothetical protein